MSPFFVEFLGLPGAGKTTVANEVVRILAARGYRVDRRPPLVKGSAGRLRHSLRLRWFHMTRLRLVWSGLRYTLSVRPLRLSRLRHIRQAFFLAYYLEQMQKSDFQVVVRCQSILNALWSASVPGHQLDERWLGHFLSHAFQELSGSLIFVPVQVPASTAAERAVKRARAGSRFDALPLEEAIRLLAIHQDRMRLVLESALRATGAHVCEVDGTAAPAENAVRIADFIEALLEAGEPA